MYTVEEIKNHRELISNNIVKGFSNSVDLLEKAHNQGDAHPNGKWYWESSANGGKGDWRTIKGASKSTSSASVDKPKHKVEDKKDDKGQKLSNILENILENKEFQEFLLENYDLPRDEFKKMSKEDLIDGYCHDVGFFIRSIDEDYKTGILSEQHVIIKYNEKYYDGWNTSGVKKLSELHYVKTTKTLKVKKEEELHKSLKMLNKNTI